MQSPKKNQSSHDSLTLGFFLRRYGFAYGAGFLLLMATNALSLVLPWIIKLAVDNIQTFQDQRFLNSCALAIFLLALGYAFLRIVSRIVIFGAGRDIEGEIRERLYAHLQTLDQTFYDKTPHGEVVSLLTNDTNVVRLFFGLGVLNFLNGLILYVMASVVMVSLNPKLALFALFPYLFMVAILGKISPRFHTYSRLVQEEIAHMTEFIQENISAQEVLRSFQKGDLQRTRFHEISQRYLRANVSLAKIRGVLFTSTSAISGMGTLLLLWIGGEQVIRGQIGLGDFIAFFGFLSLLVMPTLMFGFVISVWQRGRASFERIQAFLQKKSMVNDPEFPVMTTKEKIKGQLTIRNLSFSYPGRNHDSIPALHNVSFEIPAGQVTAIVGAVGSGKSTLVKLLAKLYPVPSKSIFVDGTDVNDFRVADLRSFFGVATQDIFLFSRTVMENIAFGLVHPEDNVNRFAQAAQVGLAQGENDLPLATRVGERGVLLSGGQRQRIALARGLASQAPIFVFDEPFSSLDYQTASRIMAAMRQEFPQSTVVLITQKISFIEKANQIVVMKDGGVVQVGNHQDLLKTSTIYQALFTKEKLEHENV